MGAKYCEVCNEEIPRGQMSYSNKKYQNKKFCSAKCHHQAMKIEYEYQCANCGSTVIRTKPDLPRVFCNDHCMGKVLGKAKKGKRDPGLISTKLTKRCPTCDEEFITTTIRNKKYCSQSCSAIGWIDVKNKKIRHTVICDCCHKDIQKVESDIRELNFCSTDCMHTYYSESEMFSGENSATWNGGKIHYRGANWISQREKARKRDKYKCTKCGISETDLDKELSVHHIIPFIMFKSYKDANKLSNLTSVCEPCHRKIHTGDNHPSKFDETYGWMFG